MTGPSFRRGHFSRLGGVVNNTLDQLGLRHKILEHQALSRWPEVVGPQIASSSSADRVSDGILFVSCKSSMWANELTLHREQILTRLNKALGKKVIVDIRFSARGFRKGQPAEPKEQRGTRSKNLEAIQLPDEKVEAARAAAASSPAPELAERIEKAILASKRLEELKRQEGWKSCPKCGNLHNAKGDLCANCR